MWVIMSDSYISLGESRNSVILWSFHIHYHSYHHCKWCLWRTCCHHTMNKETKLREIKWLVQNSSLLTGWTEPVLKHSILVLLQCSFVGKLSFFPSSVGKNPVPPSRVCLPRESSLLVTQNTSLLTHLVTKYVEVFPSQQQENVRHQLGVPQFNSILMLSDIASDPTG